MSYFQFKKFHKDIIAELERKTELDQKYMNVSIYSFDFSFILKTRFFSGTKISLTKP